MTKDAAREGETEQLLEIARGWVKSFELVERWAEAEHERRMVSTIRQQAERIEALQEIIRELLNFSERGILTYDRWDRARAALTGTAAPEVETPK